MFHGTATITPKNGTPPFTMTGTWLYHPEKRYWFCNKDDSNSAWWAIGVDPAIMSDIKDDDAQAPET